MKNSFWGLIWSSFWEIQGFVIGLLSLGITIILAIFVGNTPIPLYWFFIVVSVALFIIATLLKVSYAAFKQYQKILKSVLPKLVYARKNQQTGYIECLLEPSEILAYDMYISFYYTDADGFETLIGVGLIKNVTSKKNLQATITYPESTYQEILDKLANNDVKVLNQVIVKPGIPTSFLSTIKE